MAVSPARGLGLAHRHLYMADPNATPTLGTRCSIPTHHEVGICDVVLDQTPTQDNHARALGKDGLCVDEPQIWGRAL